MLVLSHPCYARLVAAQVTCKHYLVKTLPSGDRLERCRVDAAESIPFSCPEGCLFFEPRARISRIGWIEPRRDEDR